MLHAETLNSAGQRQGCKEIKSVAARAKVSLVRCSAEGVSSGAGGSDNLPAQLWSHRTSGTFSELSHLCFLPSSQA